MARIDRLKLNRNASDALQALASIEKLTSASKLNVNLRHLVKLRASQINGCGHCVAMHTDEARLDGETNERLDRLVVWREVADFTEDECAALACTEALTQLRDTENISRIHKELTRHYTDGQIATLTVTVAMINVWNRLNIAAFGGNNKEELQHVA